MPAVPVAGRPGARLTAAVAGAVALVLAACAFVADGGLGLERTTYVEVGLMALGALLMAAALVLPQARSRPLHGWAVMLAFALLAAYTAFSTLWSLAPSDSWIEAGRTLAYLFAFAGTMALARLAPGQWPAVLHGLALACLVVCCWALLTKIFPGGLSPDETYARLRAPFGYWNATGLMAALGLLPLLWLGARRSGHAAFNALAWPGIALLEVCLMLSYSRGALLAGVVGVACWFAVVPLRLRGAIVLLGATAGAAPVVGWAFSMTGLTQDELPLAVRADTGHELGALLLLMAVLLLALGLVTGFLADEHPASEQAKRFAGRLLLGVLALVAVVLVVALASAPGGIDGQISKTWDQLTNPNAPTPANTPGRFTAASSVRARYWDEAFAVHGVAPLVGTGAGAYATVRTRFRKDALFVRHAHGYVPQTLADLGWTGLALSLLLLGLWAWSAARVLGLRLRDRGLAWDPERVGVATLAAVALVFGLHSAIDWTWFVPANAVAGLMAAAWVVARPPLRERLAVGAGAAGGRRPRRRAGRSSRGIAVGAGPRGGARGGRRGGARRAPGGRRRVGAPAPVPVGGGGRRRAGAGLRDGRRLDRLAARPRPPRRRRRDRPAGEGRARRRRVDRRDRARPQPALARAAVGARLHRGAARAAGQRRAGAPAGRGDPAGERRGLAPPRPLPALDAQPARRRRRVLPRGLLPRPAQPAVDVGPARGDPRGGAAAGALGALRPRNERLPQQRRPAERGERHGGEARGLERALERAARVEAHVLAERVVVGVEVRQRDHRALHAAVLGHREQEPPAGPQDAADLGQEADGVGHVLEHLRAPDEIDLAVPERQAAVGRDPAQVGARGDAAGALERRLGELDADGIGARVAQRGDEAPGSAAEVEHALAGPRLAQQESAAAAPLPRLRILGLGRPCALVVLAHPGYGCTQRCICA